MQNSASQVAVAEALNPTLGVTEQVLAVRKPVVRDRNTSVLLVDENEAIRNVHQWQKYRYSHHQICR
ncbi:MAG: hypothetical protein AAFW75_12575 [Cyanobacteria bacterium J06636_16]